MRCLYCGKELALLKRLTGGGDFCSDAHKQSYQEEYNRLALSRLLQAQKKGQQTNSPAQSAPPADASIAVEEPVEDEAAIRAESSPVLEVAVEEASVSEVSEAVMDSSAVDESTAEAETSPEDSLSAEPEPSQAAGFLLESPAIAAVTTEDSPYLEPWLELSPGPAMSEWQLQNGSFSLSSADLVAVDLRPTPSSIPDHASAIDLTTQAFAGAPPNPSLSWAPNT